MTTDHFNDALNYIELNPDALESRLMAALISDYETALHASEHHLSRHHDALRPLYAELDDYSVSLTDERIDFLRDSIIDVARAALAEAAA